MQFKKRTAAAIGAGSVVAAGVAGFALLAGPAHAEEPAPAPSGSSSAAPGQPGQNPADRRAEHQQELAAALAKELGIDQAKVAAALEKVRTEQQNAAKADRLEALKTRLDAAVKDGKLTAAQRDAILKAAEAGVLPGGGPGGLGGPGGFGGRGGPGGWGHGPR